MISERCTIVLALTTAGMLCSCSQDTRAPQAPSTTSSQLPAVNPAPKTKTMHPFLGVEEHRKHVRPGKPAPAKATGLHGGRPGVG